MTTGRWRPPASAPAAVVLTKTVWHQGAVRHDVLRITDPAKYPGRFRRIGGVGTWYGASSRRAAWAELLRHAEQLRPEDLSPRRVAQVLAQELRTLDLTDPHTAGGLGISAEMLISDDQGDLEDLAEIAQWAARSGWYQGLLVPSAAERDECTLVVFPQGMSALKVTSDTVESMETPQRRRGTAG